MTRHALTVLLLAAAASAQVPKPPPPGDLLEATANPRWEHPFGDEAGKAPCVHKSKQHPGGDLAPCPCPKKVQHADGDESTVPCVHQRLEHPGGDDTGKKVPCVHLKNGRPEHGGGDPVMAPCTHKAAEHPGGDKVKTPCKHFVTKHPDGEPGTNVPCVHLVNQHPEGDPVRVPCEHLLKKVKSLKDPPVDFYTDDAEVQRLVAEGIGRLKALGVKFDWKRPLAVFYREPVNGNPDDNKDPFWHHCDGVQKVIVITRTADAWIAKNQPAKEDERRAWLADRKEFFDFTVRHELGHALIGGRCVIVPSLGSPHNMTKEQTAAGAMAEGWANFVGAALTFERGDAAPVWRGWNFETPNAPDDVKLTQKIEYRVACFLWDCYDNAVVIPARGPQRRDETLEFKFTDLLEVWGDTLETLPNGPVMPDARSFMNRLSNNHPDLAQKIEGAFEMHMQDEFKGR
ncbi:MAG: hypothetical protein IT452_07630 [Planctomycetia bacterium]|nr:hypothetical protein [Planctomycetia bacterium]